MLSPMTWTLSLTKAIINYFNEKYHDWFINGGLLQLEKTWKNKLITVLIY